MWITLTLLKYLKVKVNNMQLILMAETKTKDGSDYKYIKEFINEYYGIRGNKLSPIPLHGKANYRKKAKIIEQYVAGYIGESYVIIFIDIDSPTYNMDQKFLNQEIIDYCNKMGYQLVWFNKSIENVFLGKIIKKNKEKEADDFLRKNKIKKVDLNKMSVPYFNYSREGESNIKVILDRIFNKNQTNDCKIKEKKKKVPQ